MENIFPINFSICKTKIVDKVPIKTKLLSMIVPGEPYSFDNEKDYYAEYQSSFFAITKKKDGWDCMRHYEILANGCIPYFLNMEECPINTMTTFPFKIVKEAMSLYDVMKQEEEPLSNKVNVNKCIFYIELLLEHTRVYLTNEAVVSYILKKNK